MSNKTKTVTDVQQIIVKPNGKISIALVHRELDEDGFELSSSVEKLTFEKNANVSNHIPTVQKICNDAWV